MVLVQSPLDVDISSHRSTGTVTQRLLSGGDSGGLDNFELALSTIGEDFFTPRHRHNFDQIRYVVSGSYQIAPGRRVPAGSVIYLTEGAFYGPEEHNGGCQILGIQMGGASGSGFMSYDDLAEGRRRLLEKGTFVDGVYQTTSGGSLRKADAYQAIWEEMHDVPFVYPKARFDGPVVVNPDAFAPTPVGEGVVRRTAGPFNEAGTAFSFFDLEPGASMALGSDRARLVNVVLRGAVRIDSEPIGSLEAFGLSKGESVAVHADQPTRLYSIRLRDA